jgi:hypothetical protein
VVVVVGGAVGAVVGGVVGAVVGTVGGVVDVAGTVDVVGTVVEAEGNTVVLLPVGVEGIDSVVEGAVGRELRSGLDVLTGTSNRITTANSRLPTAIRMRFIINNILLGCNIKLLYRKMIIIATILWKNTSLLP